MARTKDNRFGLYLSLAPASIIIGDSVSAQFFQTLIELLSTHSANVSIKAMTKGGSYWSSTGPVSQKLCAGPGCEILRSLPPHVTAAHICNGAVWLAFIRNDYLDVSALRKARRCGTADETSMSSRPKFARHFASRRISAGHNRYSRPCVTGVAAPNRVPPVIRTVP